MEQKQTFIAGNITIDDIVLPNGETYMGTIGGDVLYASMGCRFWLDEVHMLSRVNESFMKEYEPIILKSGLHYEGMGIYDEEIVRNWIIYDTDQRRYFIYRNSPELLAKLSPDVNDIPDGVHTDAIFLAAMAIENQISLARHFKERGILVLADPFDEDVTNKKDKVDELLKYVDIFLPSALEAVAYFKNEKFKENAKLFSELGPRIVVIKLGKDGCLVYDKAQDRYWEIPAYEVNVVDLTGAGDAFGGGFTAGYLLTGDPVAAAAMGSISSSFAIEGFGSLPLFEKTREEAKQRLEEFLDVIEQNK